MPNSWEISSGAYYTPGTPFGSIVVAGLAETVINEDGLTTGDFRVESDSYTHFIFSDASANKLAIGTLTAAGDGLVHIHSGTAGTIAAHASTDELTIEGAGDAGMGILTPNGSTGAIQFGSPADSSGARVGWNYSGLLMTVGTTISNGLLSLVSGDGAEAIRAIANGDVGINDATPTHKLDVNGTFRATGAVTLDTELAVNYLADGTAHQLLETASDGTTVQWATDIDIPGRLDVTGTVTLDTELAVNYLADGTARQLLETAADGATVQWATDIDIPGTLDVTGRTTVMTLDVTGATTLGSTLAVSGAVTLSTELAVDYLADGTARQLLETAANGTTVQWATNIDIPGTLDVTGAVTLDTELAVNYLADGSARQLLETAPNGTTVQWATNIDIPGTLDVTGAVTLDTELAVSYLADGAARQLLETAADGATVQWATNIDVPGTLDVTGAAVLDSTLAVATSAMVGSTVGSPDGTLHVRTADASAAAHTNANDLVVEGSAIAGMSFLTASGGTALIYFGDAAQSTEGAIAYGHTNNNMEFYTSITTASNGTPVMTLDASKHVGIGVGVGSIVARLHINETVAYYPGVLIKTHSGNNLTLDTDFVGLFGHMKILQGGALQGYFGMDASSNMAFLSTGAAPIIAFTDAGNVLLNTAATTGIDGIGLRVSSFTHATIVLDAAASNDSQLKFTEGGTLKWNLYNDGGDADILKWADGGGTHMALDTAGLLNLIGNFQCDGITNDTGLAAGTYTPTITATENLGGSTAYQCQYMRVGNTVTVSGQFLIDPTGGSTGTAWRITLPVASNFGATEDCCGVGAFDPSTASHAAVRVFAETASNQAGFAMWSVGLLSAVCSFTFTYQVI
jgi:carbon monoxide dehydrogenase subunit G